MTPLKTMNQPPQTHPPNPISPPPTPQQFQLRIIVLDEKRRLELICLVALCYKFAAMFANNPQVLPECRGMHAGAHTCL